MSSGGRGEASAVIDVSQPAARAPLPASEAMLAPCRILVRRVRHHLLALVAAVSAGAQTSRHGEETGQRDGEKQAAAARPTPRVREALIRCPSILAMARPRSASIVTCSAGPSRRPGCGSPCRRTPGHALAFTLHNRQTYSERGQGRRAFARYTATLRVASGTGRPRPGRGAEFRTEKDLVSGSPAPRGRRQGGGADRRRVVSVPRPSAR
jgi:hypothetical protein